MKSVADSLAAKTEAEVRALSASERIALALRLGDRDAKIYAAANSVPEETARRILARNNRAGRRPSVANDE